MRVLGVNMKIKIINLSNVMDEIQKFKIFTYYKNPKKKLRPLLC